MRQIFDRVQLIKPDCPEYILNAAFLTSLGADYQTFLDGVSCQGNISFLQLTDAMRKREVQKKILTRSSSSTIIKDNAMFVANK